MPRPSLKAHKYMTTARVAKKLGMADSTVVRWIDHGIFPWPTGMEGKTRDRVIGYWVAPKAAYMTTGSRMPRAVIVAKTYLGDQYPKDEQDILAIPCAANAVAGK